MSWNVTIKPKVAKGLHRLPVSVQDQLLALAREMELTGPVRGNWPNYSKLGPTRHHCHLRKGRPTYVAVWEERPDGIRLIEVTYAGTHEKAPY